MKVLGYHGTDRRGADAILKSNVVNTSSGSGHWLGTGAYFFQDAPLHALVWARERHNISAADAVVIYCEIDLTSCLDLFDRRVFNMMRRVYHRFEQEEAATGFVTTQVGLTVLRGVVSVSSPIAVRGLADNYRDQALLDWYVSLLQKNGLQDIKTIRGPFLWGRAIYSDSFLFDWAHCQIAVRDGAVLSPPKIYQWT